MRNAFLLLSLFICAQSFAQIQISGFTQNTASQFTPTTLLEYNGKLYFNGSTDGVGHEVWTTDGTSENTALLKDIDPLEADGLKIGIVSAKLNSDLYFLAKNDYNYSGGEIWKTNGTTAGTIKISDYTGRVNALTTVGNQIFFITNSDEFHYSLWKTDGTSTGTTLVYGPTGTSGPPRFQGTANNTFIYTLPLNDSVVWRSDGSAAGTYALTGSLDGNGSGQAGSSDLTQYIEYNGKLYFVSRYYLHQTDGTLANTSVVANVWNASNHLVSFSDAIVINNKMYLLFYSYSAATLSIYESNGTQEGTFQIYSEPWSQQVKPSRIFNDNGNLLFTTQNLSGGTSLKSLNTITNQVSEVTVISTQDDADFVYMNRPGTIHKITEGNYFFSRPSGIYNNKGYVYNSTANTVTHIDGLDDIAAAMVYNQGLYYSKNGQLYKYSNNLDVQYISDISLSLFPVPASDVVYFSRPEVFRSAEIYDLNGRLVLSLPELKDNGIDISILNSGVYVVKAKDLNGKTTVGKIIRK